MFQVHDLPVPHRVTAIAKQAQERLICGRIRRPEVCPHAIFLGDYDRLLTEHLVQGVDVWLNTPRRPWEACGTSGMKVLLNGGINLLELDGWWAQPTALPIAPVCRQSAR